jgi:hypothetical protein
MRCLGSASVLLAGLTLCLTGVGAAEAFGPAADGPVVEHCSRQAAEQAAGEHSGFVGFVKDPIQQVLCGSFAGPGSATMAVTFAAPTCWSPQGWAVYSFSNGAWELVLDRPGVFLSRDLAAVGGKIEETTPIFRSSDPRCVPSGGRRARSWRWDGKRFVVGPWRRVAPGARRTSADFYSPSRNIACEMSDGRGESHVFCESFAHPHSVTMGLRGRLTICRGGTRTTTHCLGDPGERTPVLRYGRSITLTHFRCRSEQAGVTCTVVGSGKGFRIDRTTVTRVGAR